MNLAILLAIGAGLGWGVGEVFTKTVLQTKEIGPITAIAVRTTIELPILWLAYWFVVVKGGHEPRNWWRVGDAAAGGAQLMTVLKMTIGSGIIAGAIGMLCFYSALHLGEISKIKPIAFSLAPAIGVLLGWLILKEPMTLKKGIGIVMILSGVIILTGKQKPAALSTSPQGSPATQ